MKVLRLIPGLLDALPGQRITHSALFSTVTNRTLVFHDAYSHVGVRYNSDPKLGVRGVEREQLQRALVEQAEARGIPIHWGFHLQSLTEISDNCVELHFANGEARQASFVVGCDGLHSNTRTTLFGEMKPEYTGLVQAKKIPCY